MLTIVISTLSKIKVTELLKFRKLHFSRSISFAILAWSSKLMVDYDIMGPNIQLVRAEIFDFPCQKAITWVQTSQTVDITGISTGHISVLLEATVTWSGVLVVLYVLCMLIWPWPDPRSRSRSRGFWTSENCTLLCLSRSSAILAWSSKMIVDYDSMGPNLHLFSAKFLNFSPVGGHMTSKLAKCWYPQNLPCFVSALPEARSLWLWLQGGNNKPCTLAAMTINPLPGLFLKMQLNILENIIYLNLLPVLKASYTE